MTYAWINGTDFFQSFNFFEHPVGPRFSHTLQDNLLGFIIIGVSVIAWISYRLAILFDELPIQSWIWLHSLENIIDKPAMDYFLLRIKVKEFSPPLSINYRQSTVLHSSLLFKLVLN